MADSIFKQNYRLRSADFDRFLEIKPSSVLDLFQSVAGLHAENLGVGFNAMVEKGYLWVILKVKYEIIRMPKMYENITALTWPKEPKRLDFMRNYQILDETGNVIIKGTSQWAVIDKETRKLTRATDVYKNLDGFCEDEVFAEKIARVPDFEENTPELTVKSGYCDFDSNGHVNNIRYADFVFNAIKPEKPLDVKTFQLDFHKEIINETTDIFITEENNTILAKGMQGESIMFSCKIERN